MAGLPMPCGGDSLVFWDGLLWVENNEDEDVAVKIPMLMKIRMLLMKIRILLVMKIRILMELAEAS